MANTEMLADVTHAEPHVEPSRGSNVAPSVARDLVALTKPRITLMVILTGAVGMCLAPGHVGQAKLWLSLVGTALVVASANALNMWWERDVDGLMGRTQNRPLPAGRMSHTLALAFGLALGAASMPLLFAVNVATGALGLLALVTYVLIYTPMKRVTWLALLVGAVPGAMPPLMGWTTVTGSIDVGGLLLFGVLFLWQIPHFAAITLFRTQDYARAGLQVIAVQRGERAANHVIVGYTVLLVVNTLLLYPFHLAGARYLGVAIVTGAIFLGLGLRRLGRTEESGVDAKARAKSAKMLFAYSIVYLVALLTTLLLDRVVA